MESPMTSGSAMDRHGEPAQERDEKKAYVAPRLIVHGPVEKLTGWKGFGGGDFSFDEDVLGTDS